MATSKYPSQHPIPQTMATITTLPTPEITYCEGALLLQTTSTPLGSILLQRPSGALICQHCYLLVADAQDVKAIAPDQDWSLLVSCHVQACSSLHDRRAMYSCFACHERGGTEVQKSMVALREHLGGCEVMRLKGREGEGLRKGRGKEGMGGRKGARGGEVPLPMAATAREPVAAQSPTGARKTTSNNPFAGTLNFQPQSSRPQPSIPIEINPPLPNRPRTGPPPPPPPPPTNAERMYTPAAVLGPERIIPQSSPSNPAPPNSFSIPGGFPDFMTHSGNDSRTSSMLDYNSPTIPRRKEVRPDGLSEKTFPNQPARAPPLPPVLSPPAPPPYYQGKTAPTDPNNYQPSPVSSSHDSRHDSFPAVDVVKIQQLVSLGIPRLDAEYLLNRTGGDVNAAAELQLSEMGSLAGPVREQTPSQPVSHPNPLGSSPVERRNRRSK